MTLVLPRRRFLTGLATAGVLLAAPTIVRASSLMPIKPLPDLAVDMRGLVLKQLDQEVQLALLNIVSVDTGNYRNAAILAGGGLAPETARRLGALA